MGIEPTSRAWEARVIAIIRRPLNGDSKIFFFGVHVKGEEGIGLRIKS